MAAFVNVFERRPVVLLKGSVIGRHPKTFTIPVIELLFGNARC